MTETELKVLSNRVKAITRPQPQLLWYYALSSFVAFCGAPLLWLPLYFRYHTLWYRFDDQGVSMGFGILFRREMQLTYARMQDIHLSQNLLERWLGIGTVTVQTAGGSQGHLSIVGVKDFEAIRNYLYARMRGVRPDAHEAHDATGNDAVLVEIRDALKAVAKALSERAP